ncbi:MULTISPECIES: hypothetical protein [unclassified Clostridium]|uniref:hypothetical protein n=1 Tax=unclassified Clostridium TaxID=2614128 RepID=UPI000297D8DC|nr:MULTISPECIES: hypothetical protein [unclassified Clostridium]EKQ54421.1 MAG: hypothetical protein A370_03245 [Clostridium sp. Maddingley MBC34-26]
MNKGSKSDSNNLQSFYSVSSDETNKQQNLSNNSQSNENSSGERKNEGYNDWNSVPVTYDKEESTKKHEKSATNNQWTSTHK